MKLTQLILVLLFAMTLSNCNNNKSDQTNQSQNKNTSDRISVEFLKSEFDAGKEFYLLDVRTKAEYKLGRLSFADDLIPYDSMHLYLEKLPQDKKTTMYIFCRSGRRSAIATTYLRSLGYIKAYNVTGGIIAWQDSGYEVVSDN